MSDRVIQIETFDGFTHSIPLIDGAPDFETYSSSSNTRQILQTSFDEAVEASGLSQAEWLTANTIELELQSEPEQEPQWTEAAVARYQMPAYKELLRGSYGTEVALFEASIRAGEYGPAIAILSGVVEAGAISPELATALAESSRQFHLPEELIQALLGVLGEV